uniref:Dickkopf-related protein 3-like n=1 Tax=Geotrypetes seraphini TaxID=260995 RepID=A0A6P8ND12_GEOSA|nr:dickkopf-related protein 3-like [Geotrypetes seraphini]
MGTPALLWMLCFLSFLPASQGSIWAWMFSMPYETSEEATALFRSTRPPVGTQEHKVSCDQERSCGKGQFCDRHFGLCVPLQQEGQYCRKDSQCIRGLGCMFGKCHRMSPGGQEGARCKQDKDCGASMCCARHHGEMICKKRLKLGDRCYIPEGGLTFSINQICPCHEGLICRIGELPKEKDFEYWQEAEDWRCLRLFSP